MNEIIRPIQQRSLTFRLRIVIVILSFLLFTLIGVQVLSSPITRYQGTIVNTSKLAENSKIEIPQLQKPIIIASRQHEDHNNITIFGNENVSSITKTETQIDTENKFSYDQKRYLEFLGSSSIDEPNSNYAPDTYKLKDLGLKNIPQTSSLVSTQYENHSPIYIYGNTDFIDQAKKENWTGDGTLSSPYVIDGLIITGPASKLIEIRNTDVHFRISNSAFIQGNRGIYLHNVVNGQLSTNIIYNNSGTGIYLHSSNTIVSGNTVANNNYNGIYIWDSENNIISGNTVINNSGGIFLRNSGRNTLSGNTVANNSGDGISLMVSGNSTISDNTVANNGGDGIYLQDSNNGVISNNVVSNNNEEGIVLASSRNNKILDNILVNNAFYVEVGTFEDYFQTVVSNNTINGKALIYWYNFAEETVPRGAGQVILVNCTAVTVTTQNLSYVSVGLQVISSSNVSILNNTMTNNSRSGIQLEDSTDITISNNSVSNSYYGIYLWDSRNCTISDNTVSNNYDGIYLWDSRNNTISDNIVSNNRWEGIILSSSRSNKILDNILVNNDFYVEGGTFEDYFQTVVSNNTINGKALIYWNNFAEETVPRGAGQVILVNCTAVTVATQNLSYVSVGLHVISSSNVSILNNIMTNNSRSGIQLGDSTDITISNNIVSNNSYYGIDLGGSTDITISNNTITNNNWDGIQLRDSTDVTISNNIVSNNKDGIDLGWSTGITIFDNTITNNSRTGISLRGSWNNTISGNTVANNNGIGVYLGSYWWWWSENNIISDNTVANNSGDGISLQSSRNNTVSGNTVANNNDYGIYLGNSWKNIVIFNNFYENNTNGPQAADDSSNNLFEYNFWYEWTSPDSDDDGIVDEPYPIDDDNQDLFPLTSPYSQTHPNIHVLVTPRIIYPNGGENLNNTITIYWFTSSDSFGHPITYSIYYSSDSGTNWEFLDFTLSSSSYSWNTILLPPATTYMIKVVAQCSEGKTAEDISDGTFRILNFPTTHSSTPTTSISSTTDTHPFSGFTVIFLLFAVPLIIRNRRNRR